MLFELFIDRFMKLLERFLVVYSFMMTSDSFLLSRHSAELRIALNYSLFTLIDLAFSIFKVPVSGSLLNVFRICSAS